MPLSRSVSQSQRCQREVFLVFSQFVHPEGLDRKGQLAIGVWVVSALCWVITTYNGHCTESSCWLPVAIFVYCLGVCCMVHSPSFFAFHCPFSSALTAIFTFSTSWNSLDKLFRRVSSLLRAGQDKRQILSREAPKGRYTAIESSHDRSMSGLSESFHNRRGDNWMISKSQQAPSVI